MKHHNATANEEIQKLLSAYNTAGEATNIKPNKAPFHSGNGEDNGDEDPPPSRPKEDPPDEEPTEIPPDEEGWDEPPETWPDVPPSPVRDDPPFF